ncbi:MAG: histidinol-phosphate transaminase [Candidatus Jordarchaeum sp.]|uniref:histidinol-phosphate transaminase n=1 Tax=Candidatus Jordarchaeum sp. TaxID=2823881 RepID=UPI004049841E
MGYIKKFFKPYIDEAQVYSPGGVLRLLYQQRQDWIRMMSNESPFEPSPRVLEAVEEAIHKAGWYYDSDFVELREAIANYIGFEAERILVGNGSTEILDMIFRGFINPGDEVILSDPTYPLYPIRIEVAGGKNVIVPKILPEYYWDIKGIIKSITPRTKIIIIDSPNNPVGNTIAEEDLKKLLEQNVLVVLDEAYGEFADKPLTHLAKKYENIIVTRTLSKAFGLAALRIGYTIATPEIINYLTKIKIPFNVNYIAVQAAIAALSDKEYLKRVKNDIARGREYLHKEISAIDGLEAFPSQANFVLVKITKPGVTGTDIEWKLADKLVLTRKYTGKAGLIGEYTRITVRSMDENRRCVEALRKIMREY